MRRVTLAVVAVVMLGLLSVPGFANHISGELSIDGTWRVFATAIDFYPLGGGTGTGNNSPFPATNGIFPPGGTYTILDISAIPQAGFSTLPVGGSLPNFLNTGNYRFDVTSLLPGAGTPSADCSTAVTMTCTPILPTAPPQLSPFTLVNINNNSSIASFQVVGNVVDTTNNHSANFSGTFTSQFPGQTYQQVVAQLQAAGHIDRSFSATFVVPEPGTLSIFGLSGALFALGGVLRRFRK